ncbi:MULTISPECIES: ATP-binding protein [Acinetobacter]|uniref:ATP-binding protein n=1 Tax=Acinetobacter TaxID=469 RepID=UPI002003E6C0|nr:ATP-binding protein [Acinetobacter radioresistens]MCK4081875.1 two-component sensor histidine kinase [Acinetobacter radioresistens]MCU4501261.1 two-component sensor histidine kinase [Acinetobacter radioresistens]
MNTKPDSLQSQLIRTTMLGSILAGLLAFLLLIGIAVYHAMQVHDEIMDELADTLLVSDLSANSGQLDELSNEFDIQYQLNWQGRTLAHSTHLQQQLFNNLSQDFGLVWKNGHLWRSYTAQTNDEQLKAELIQPLAVRFKDIIRSILIYAVVLLLVWLVQWLWSHFGIQRQLRSLKKLSRTIAQKSPTDLQPIEQQPLVQEIEPVINSLNQLLSRLDRALTAEQRFTADASHELRSPLSAIAMRLQVLKRKYSHIPELVPDLLAIQNDVTRSTRVLENLLLLARLDPAAHQQMLGSLLQLQPLIDEVVCSLELFAQERQVSIHQMAALPHAEIYGNQELLFTCIRNLIDNAIRYAPEHGAVYITLKDEQHHYRLMIEDNGAGVDSNTLERLGERFFRGLGTRTSGSGLGLSIARKIMELHRGYIEFTPSDYGGLKVTLLFLKAHQIEYK